MSILIRGIDRALRASRIDSRSVGVGPTLAIMSSMRFPIRVGRRSWPVLMFFGVRADNAWIDLDGDVVVRFGWYHFRTPVANLASWRIEGPWLWITAIGVRI